jgi:hypothetical protein
MSVGRPRKKRRLDSYCPLLLAPQSYRVGYFSKRKNIKALLDEVNAGWPGVNLLHIDFDGNERWI